MVEYISPAPVVISSSEPVVKFPAPATAVISSPDPVVEYLAPAPVVIQSTTPVVEYLAPVPAVFQAPTPVVEYLAPAPVVFPAPVEEYISPVPVVDAVPAPVMECIAPSAHKQFFFSLSLSHQRLQTQRHTPRLSTAPRVEGASRLRLVRQDSVLWTRPGTCLTCRWSESCVLLWRLVYEWTRTKRERNSWRGLCYISVMSCSRAPVMGTTVTLLRLLAGGTWPDS